MLHKHGSSRPHTSLLYKGRGAFLKSVSTHSYPDLCSIFFFSFFFSNPFLNIPHFIKHWTSLSRFFAQTYLHIFVLASHFVLSKIQRSFFQKISFSFKHSCICFSPVLKLKKNIWYCNWRFKLSRLHSIVLLEYVGFHF